MFLSTLLLAAWLDAGAVLAPRCTIVRTGLPTRPEQVTFTVLRATACQRHVPASALFIESGELLVVRDARPPSEWIAGLPTFDMIEMSDDVYPSRQDLIRGVQDSVPRLSFAEFIADVVEAAA